MDLFNKISHVNLYSENNLELIKFFRDVLGMTPHPNQTEGDNWYGFYAGEGLHFAIEPQSNRVSHEQYGHNKKNPILIQFAAESQEQLEAMNRHLKDNGTELLTESKEKSYGIITNFKDPDGNLYEILLRPDGRKDE